MNKEIYGAALERGIIENIEAGRYRVESLSRYGIKSLPIRAMDQETELKAGDRVYFFLFEDGDGLILGKM